MEEIRQKARSLMKGFCRVCPVCDGRACAGEVPGMGGLGTGSAFQDNVCALSEHRFNMRCLHDSAEPELSLSLLGFELAMPVRPTGECAAAETCCGCWPWAPMP